MSKIFNIIKFNVNKNIRNKWFVIINVIFFVVALVVSNFSTVKELLKQNDISFDHKVIVSIKDDTNELYDSLNESLSALENTEVKREYEEKEYTKENVTKEDIIVILKESKEENKGLFKDVDVTVISTEGVDSKYIDIIESKIKERRKEAFLKNHNIDLVEYESIEEDVSLNRIMLQVEGSNISKKYKLQSICNYIIFFILLIILTKIANDISVEKVNKSIEYVLTSIEAKSYLIAKILSVIFTFIIQVVFSCMYLLISTLVNSYLKMYLVKDLSLNTDASTSMLNMGGIIDANFLLYLAVAFVFLIFTIFLICIIQAIFSSKTSDIDEASNSSILLLTLNVIIYVFSTFLVSPLKAPSMLSYIVSCVPIVSMYFVPTMVILGQAKIWQIVISILLLVITTIFALKYGAIAFKNGVLDYTKKKKITKEEKIKEIEKEKLLKYEYSKIGYVIGFSVILFVLLQIILSYVSQFILANISSESLVLSRVLEIFTFIISLLIPSIFVMTHTEKESKEIDKNNKKVLKKDNKKDIKEIIKCVVVALPIVFVVQIVVGLILEKLGLNYDLIDKVDIFSDKSLLGKILFFVEVAILPAIFEELYIRKAILNYTKKYGTVFAIIFSALVFATIHFNFSQMLFAFIMGIILAVIAIRTNSIIASGIIHLLNNGYAAMTLIFENTPSILLLINFIYLAVILIGIVMIISKIISNKEKITVLRKNRVKEEKETKGLKKYMYIFYDYTFILAVIMCIVMILVTEKTIALL